MAKKEVINKVCNSIGLVILIGLFLLGKTFLFYQYTIAMNEPLEAMTILGTISFILVVICFLSILPNRTRIVTTIIVDLLISLVLFGDHIYYIFFQTMYYLLHKLAIFNMEER